MNKKIVEFTERTFQPLFHDMDLFLELAKVEHALIHSQTLNEAVMSQKVWLKEKAFSRASFVLGMAGLEAFCNALLEDYRKQEPRVLVNFGVNRKRLKKSLDRWTLFDKIIYLPTLCNTELLNPSRFFDRESEKCLLLEEMVDVRNEMLHSQLVTRKVELDVGSKKNVNGRNVIPASDQFPENFWPISQFPRDLAVFSYPCALKARDCVDWFRTQLRQHLRGTVPENYMTATEGTIHN